MPRSEQDLARAVFLRVLLMGYPKTGKTTTCLRTAGDLMPKGARAYVINCDQESSLTPAKRMGVKFDWDMVRTPVDIDNALMHAKRGADTGKYGLVILDTMTNFARHMRDFYEEASRGQGGRGEPDGRRFWDQMANRLLRTVDLLMALKCHVVCVAHYSEVSAEIDGQIQKTGDGIVPLIQGRARNQIAGMFDDCVFFTKRTDPKKPGEVIREFVLKDGGKFGPGGRSQDTVDVIPADLSELWELYQGANSPDKAPPKARPPQLAARGR